MGCHNPLCSAPVAVRVVIIRLTSHDVIRRQVTPRSQKRRVRTMTFVKPETEAEGARLRQDFGIEMNGENRPSN
jgi:hypothetical protein